MLQIILKRMSIFVLAIVSATTPAHAQEPTCDPIAAAARSELIKSVASSTPDMHQLVLLCEPLQAMAQVQGQDIALSVSLGGVRPLFDVADATAFALYRPLIARILADAPSVARWKVSVQGYQSLGTRLAAAAARDKSWDQRLGRPKRGGVNAYVIEIANQAQIFEEFQDLASENASHARVVDVEKVMLCPAPSAPRDHVPCGGSVWFELSK
jgi:hypothetical protein